MLGRALMQSRGEDTYIKADAIIFSDFLAYARSRARQLTYIFLTLFGLAALVSALIPPHYKATATLAILPSPEFTVRQDAGSHTATAAMLALDQIMKSEIAILSSDDLYKSTIDDFGIGRLYPEIVEHAPSPWLARIALSAWHWVSRPWLPESRQSDADRALKKFSDHIRISPSKDSNVIDITYGHLEQSCVFDISG
jgi:uncharacterized protein involved in exopolysaccharide biosynthesis